MANDFQEFKGQMLGTTDAGETKKVSVDNNGKLKVVIDNSSESGSGEESGIGLVNIVDQEGNSVNEDNPFPVELFGNTLAEQKTQADAVENVITFSQNINVVEIFHAEETWQNFIVNGLTLVIPAGGYRTPIAGVPGLTVTIPAAVNCIVGRLI